MDISIYGGGFNPPTIGHEKAVDFLAERFDLNSVIPCGPRQDKRTVDAVDPIYRAAMSDLAFGSHRNVTVDLFDLERSGFTPIIELQKIFQARYPGSRIYHIVGSDLVAGGASGNSYIQRVWTEGSRLWNELNFGILSRDGSPFETANLPPHHLLLPATHNCSSTLVREAFSRGDLETAKKFLSPKVFAYDLRHGLYQNWRGPARKNAMAIGMNTRFAICADPMSEKAGRMVAELAAAELRIDDGDPEVIIAIGGDGHMLQTIRTNWRQRLPIIGLNAGHVGFLLNDLSVQDFVDQLKEGLPVNAYHLSMLFAEAEDMDSQKHHGFAFNDVWVERAGLQSAKLDVKFERPQPRRVRLVSDGALVCLSQGSAAYARAMGNQPVSPGTDAMFFVGNNVCFPADWKRGGISLSTDTEIQIEIEEADKRPVRAAIDGQDFGLIRSLTVRQSRIASTEVLFTKAYDWSEKILGLYVPSA